MSSLLFVWKELEFAWYIEDVADERVSVKLCPNGECNIFRYPKNYKNDCNNNTNIVIIWGKNATNVNR